MVKTMAVRVTITKVMVIRVVVIKATMAGIDKGITADTKTVFVLPRFVFPPFYAPNPFTKQAANWYNAIGWTA